MQLVPPINRKVKITVVTLGRLALGVTMVMFGFFRACNPILGSYMVADYLEAAGMHFFKPLSLLFTIAFAAIEFAIGVCSLLGTNIKKTSVWTVLVIGFLTPFSFYTAYCSTVPGDHQIAGIAIDDKVSCWMNLFSLFIAINLYIWRKYSKTIFTNRTQWAIGPTCLLFSIIVSLLSYFRLPMVELTPYRNGVSMSHFMVKEKMTANDFCRDAEGHMLVPHPHKITLNGDHTKVTYALQLFSPDEGDVTEQVLLQPGYTFLLVAEDLGNTSTSRRKELNNLYDYARDNGYHFYCLTTSDPASAETEEYCVESGGAEYPFLNADGRELRKMVQSRPGLILLKDGIICDKWSYFEIPTFGKRLEETDSAQPKVQSMRRKAATLLAEFALILLAILAIDWALGFLKWSWSKVYGKKKGEDNEAKTNTEH